MAGKTSISAGLVIYQALMEDEEVSKMATKIFPVAVDEAKLPYIVFRNTGLEVTPTTGKSADSLMVEIIALGEIYEEAVELAEKIRAALDYHTFRSADLHLRSCVLVDVEDFYEDDAYGVSLTFKLKL